MLGLCVRSVKVLVSKRVKMGELDKLEHLALVSKICVELENIPFRRSCIVVA